MSLWKKKTPSPTKMIFYFILLSDKNLQIWLVSIISCLSLLCLLAYYVNKINELFFFSSSWMLSKFKLILIASKSLIECTQKRDENNEHKRRDLWNDDLKFTLQILFLLFSLDITFCFVIISIHSVCSRYIQIPKFATCLMLR